MKLRVLAYAADQAHLLPRGAIAVALDRSPSWINVALENG